MAMWPLDVDADAKAPGPGVDVDADSIAGSAGAGSAGAGLPGLDGGILEPASQCELDVSVLSESAKVNVDSTSTSSLSTVIEQSTSGN